MRHIDDGWLAIFWLVTIGFAAYCLLTDTADALLAIGYVVAVCVGAPALGALLMWPSHVARERRRRAAREGRQP